MFTRVRAGAHNSAGPGTLGARVASRLRAACRSSCNVDTMPVHKAHWHRCPRGATNTSTKFYKHQFKAFSSKAQPSLVQLGSLLCTSVGTGASRLVSTTTRKSSATHAACCSPDMPSNTEVPASSLPAGCRMQQQQQCQQQSLRPWPHCGWSPPLVQQQHGPPAPASAGHASAAPLARPPSWPACPPHRSPSMLPEHQHRRPAGPCAAQPLP